MQREALKMAVTFSDLHTESGLKAIDAFLSSKSYISGSQLTKDDDDLDLFGDETEERKAAEAREAVKAPAKNKESGKSSVLMDNKPWDDETDMKKLEECVRSIKMPGLF